MIIKKLNSEHAIILCGHGSRDLDYKKELLNLGIKLQQKFQYDVFNCFIEINEPSIEECLNEVVHKYKKILCLMFHPERPMGSKKLILKSLKKFFSWI